MYLDGSSWLRSQVGFRGQGMEEPPPGRCPEVRPRFITSGEPLRSAKGARAGQAHAHAPRRGAVRDPRVVIVYAGVHGQSPARGRSSALTYTLPLLSSTGI